MKMDKGQLKNRQGLKEYVFLQILGSGLYQEDLYQKMRVLMMLPFES